MSKTASYMWSCPTLEEVKGLNTSSFLIMTFAFIRVFVLFRVQDRWS